MKKKPPYTLMRSLCSLINQLSSIQCSNRITTTIQAINRADSIQLIRFLLIMALNQIPTHKLEINVDIVQVNRE